MVSSSTSVRVESPAQGRVSKKLRTITFRRNSITPRVHNLTLEPCLTFYFSGVLDIQAFERLLGPCKELLERNIDLYAAELNQILSKDQDE